MITPSHVVGDLNAAVKGSGPRGRAVKLGAPVYQPASGYGVLIRNFNDGQPSGNQKFLASTLWHNDINAPNMVYPYNETLSATLPRNPCHMTPHAPPRAHCLAPTSTTCHMTPARQVARQDTGGRHPLSPYITSHQEEGPIPRTGVLTRGKIRQG